MAGNKELDIVHGKQACIANTQKSYLPVLREFVWTPLLVQNIDKVIRSTEGQINANENPLDITKANITMSIATVLKPRSWAIAIGH